MDHATEPDRDKMRRAAGDGARATAWVVALMGLLVVLALGVVWALRHRFSLPSTGVGPDLPTLPGKTPEPTNP